jgi:hypothetical protein
MANLFGCPLQSQYFCMGGSIAPHFFLVAGFSNYFPVYNYNCSYRDLPVFPGFLGQAEGYFHILFMAVHGLIPLTCN